jgi:hypothetical protein
MRAADYTTCAYCPRLCRHVCPVAVATGLESATPSAMMTVPLLVERGLLTTVDALSGISPCLGCGACTSHCLSHQPVAERLAGAHIALGGVPSPPAPLPPIEGDAQTVCVLTDADWAADWAAPTGTAVARLKTPDELGHASWRAGDTRVIPMVARHFAGRILVTCSGAVEAVARAAGLPVTRVNPSGSGDRFVTCFEAGASAMAQLACCGRRDGFALREPGAAQAVAEENVRLLAGRSVVCADEACAAWLRAHGARVEGPWPAEGPGE